MAKLEDILSETEVPIVVADHQGLIVRVNEAFEKTFQWNLDDLRGQTIATVIPENLRDAHHLGLSRFVTSGKPTLLNQPLDLEIMTGQGEIIKAQHYIVAEKKEGRWMFAAKITPAQ
jgi:PAS domain S-box-containing protein